MDENNCEKEFQSLIPGGDDTSHHQDLHKDIDAPNIREKMIKRITSLLEETVILEDSGNWCAKVPTMAKAIESVLFQQEKNLEDYVNENTLYDRLKLIARAHTLGNMKDVTSNKKINDCESELIDHADESIILEKKNRALKDQQQRLLLLRHASKCHFCDEGQCSITPQCYQMKLLWEHLQNCRNNSCSYSHCTSSRYVLEHFSKCKNLRCPLCGPIVVCSRRTDFVSPDQLPTLEEVRNHITKTSSGSSSSSSSQVGKCSSPSSNLNRSGGSLPQRVKLEVGTDSTTSDEATGDETVPQNDLSQEISSISIDQSLILSEAAESSSLAMRNPKTVKSHLGLAALYIAKLRYVDDPTLAPPTDVAAKTIIRKFWRVHNEGPAPWPADINIVFAGGDRMEFVSNACWAAVDEQHPEGDRYFAVSVKAPSEFGRHISLFHLTTGASLGGRSLWVGPRMKLDITVSDAKTDDANLFMSASAPFDRLAVLVDAASSAEEEYCDERKRVSAFEGCAEDKEEGEHEHEVKDDEEDDGQEQELGETGEQDSVRQGQKPGKMKKRIYRERMSAEDMVLNYENCSSFQLTKVRYINSAHERKLTTNWAGGKQRAVPRQEEPIVSADEGTVTSNAVEEIIEQKIEQVESFPMEISSATSSEWDGVDTAPPAAPAQRSPPSPVILSSGLAPAAVRVPEDKVPVVKRKRGRPPHAAPAAPTATTPSSPPSAFVSASSSTDGRKKVRKSKKPGDDAVDKQPPTEADSIHNWRLHFLACLSSSLE